MSQEIADILYNIILDSSQRAKNRKNKLISNSCDKKIVDYNELYETDLSQINNSFMPNVSNQLEMSDTLIKKKLEDQIPGITKDFIPIISNNDGHYEYELKAITPDAFKKHKMGVTYKFPKEQIGDIDLRKLLNKANLTNSYVKVGNPISVLETIDGKPHPFPMMENGKCPKGTILYIGPEDNPKTIIANLYLYNDWFDFKLNNVKLHLLVKDNNRVEFYNKRFTDDWFDFVIIEEFDTERTYISTKCNLAIKSKYTNDVSKFIEILKYSILCDDKNATTKLSVYLVSIEQTFNLINNSNNGTKDLNETDYQKIMYELSIMNKLIKIENMRNIKFNFDYNYLHHNNALVNGLCDLLINGEAKINGLTSWTLSREENENKIDVGDSFLMEIDLPDLELLDIKFEINNTKLVINGTITEKTVKDGNVLIKVNSNDVTISSK